MESQRGRVVGRNFIRRIETEPSDRMTRIVLRSRLSRSQLPSHRSLDHCGCIYRLIYMQTHRPGQHLAFPQLPAKHSSWATTRRFFLLPPELSLSANKDSSFREYRDHLHPCLSQPLGHIHCTHVFHSSLQLAHTAWAEALIQGGE